YMRIDSSGTLLVGTTSNIGNGKANITFNGGSGNGLVLNSNPSANPSTMIYFLYGGSGIGTITTNGSVVAYNTSSDYRLKENVTPMTTGLATISALRPVTYDWISDKSQGEGFIAHELQAVIPQAVCGGKDAVNEDGSVKPQGVDYSKVVVHLVAAIQELSAKNDALEARLAALEAK
ncbi:Intramolecular chaperone auto-processing domain containing protein, partial [uncultured Caudovirales phage]